jgi:hypothetical protein
MKKVLYYFLFLAFPHQLFSQYLNNDSCGAAYTLVPSTATVYKDFSFIGSTPNPSTIPNQCGQTIFPRDVWFKFNTGQYTRFQIRFQSAYGRYFFIYENNCNSYPEILCASITGTDLASNEFTLSPNTTYLLRLLSSTNFTNAIAIKAVTGSHSIHSKPAGGLWHLATTWEEGRSPEKGDSVYITDGSRVEIKNQIATSEDTLAYLQIGGSGSTKARLIVNNSAANNPLFLKGNLHVLPGDSMVYKDDYPTFHFLADIHQEGIIHSAGKGKIFIDGNGKQRWYGGGPMSGNLNSIIVNKFSDTLHLGNNIQVALLTLANGVVNNTGTIKLAPLSGFFSSNGTIDRYRGQLTHSPTFNIPTNYQYGIYTLNYKNDDSNIGYGPDSSMDVGPEYVSAGNLPVRLLLNKKRGTTLRYKGSMHARWDPLYGNCRLELRPQDTLFVHYATFYTANPNQTSSELIGDTLSSVENAVVVIDSSLFPVPLTNTYLFNSANAKMGKNGMKRAVLIQVKGNPSPTMRIVTEYVDQVPGGSVVSPLTSVTGTSLVKITSNEAFPAGKLRIGYCFFNNDFIVGNPADLRVAQAPTPNGPWKAIGTSAGQSDSLGFWPKARFSDWTVDLTNGNYFSLGTTGNAVDMQVSKVIFPPFHEIGCLNPKSIGIVVRNGGTTPASSFLVGAKNLNTDQTVLKLVALSTPLPGTKTDTIWIDETEGMYFDEPANYTLRCWVSAAGDAAPANDSTLSALNLSGNPLPYYQDFQSVVIPQGNSRFIHPRWTANDIRNDPGSNPLYWRLLTRQGNNQLFLSDMLVKKPVWVKSDLIGPLSENNELSFSYFFEYEGPPGDTFRMIGGDTLQFLISSDCGESYQPVATIDSSNFTPATGFRKAFAEFSAAPNSYVSLMVKSVKEEMNYSNLSLWVDSIRVTPITGVEKRQSLTDLDLYPNPGTEGFRLRPQQGQSLEIAGIRVYNLNGRIMDGKLISEGNEIKWEGIPAPSAGMYFVEIRQPGKSPVRKKWLVNGR